MSLASLASVSEQIWLSQAEATVGYSQRNFPAARAYLSPLPLQVLQELLCLLCPACRMLKVYRLS